MSRVTNDYLDQLCTLTFKPLSSEEYETSTLTGITPGSTVVRDDIRKSRPSVTGWRDPSPYTASSAKHVPWFGSVERSQPFGGSSFEYRRYMGSLLAIDEGAYRPEPIPRTIPSPSSVPESLVTQCENRALKKLKDMEVNLAVALAEASKAAAMVTSTATDLAKCISHIRKGQFALAAADLRLPSSAFARPWRKPRTDREVARRWLEVQYGWLPLLADVYGVTRDIQKGFLREPRVSVTHASSEVSTSEEEIPNKGIYVERRRTVTTNRVKVHLDYVLGTAALQQLSQKGLTNPAVVAWELVPYSFVVDWFVPIGEYLETLDSALGVTFKGGTVTRSVVVERTSSLGILNPASWRGTFTADAKSASRSFAMERQVYSRPPSGGLYWKNPISLKHALNALALLRVRFN